MRVRSKTSGDIEKMKNEQGFSRVGGRKRKKVCLRERERERERKRVRVKEGE